MKVLDTYCCQGGAAKGYQNSGFHVTGVDINNQPRYCGDEFHQGDAIQFILEHGHEYDFIHASPPCQRYSNAQKIQQNEHPDLVGPTRDALNEVGVPWVIENVLGAPLIDPIHLCGCMFPGLNVYRERIFEFGLWPGVPQLEHNQQIHDSEPLVKMGRPPKPGHRMHVVGNFSGAAEARVAMGMPWASRDGLREAIPPAYTRYIGKHVMERLMELEMAT